MTYDLPPIVKLAERIAAEIERTVARFSRSHKYATGARLREQAMEIVRLCNRAWRDKPRQLHWTGALVWAIDELRASMRIGKDVQAFRSFKQFEALIRLAEDLGRQAGGWKRQQEQQHRGQNPTRLPAPERAQTLSTAAASVHAGAHP